MHDFPLNTWVEVRFCELERDMVELLKSRVIGSKIPERVEQSIDGILSFPCER